MITKIYGYFQELNFFGNFRKITTNIKGDIIGGITTGIIALPLALAFGVSSGLGAKAGLVGAIILGFFAAIFGGMGGRNRDGGNMFELLALAIITPLVATILQLAISRSREYLADETGAKTVHNSLALASALEKLEAGVKHNPLRFGNPSTSSLFIVNPFSARGLIALFSTHPPMKERIKRLRQM